MDWKLKTSAWQRDVWVCVHLLYSFIGPGVCASVCWWLYLLCFCTESTEGKKRLLLKLWNKKHLLNVTYSKMWKWCIIYQNIGRERLWITNNDREKNIFPGEPLWLNSQQMCTKTTSWKVIWTSFCMTKFSKPTQKEWNPPILLNMRWFWHSSRWVSSLVCCHKHLSKYFLLVFLFLPGFSASVVLGT